MSSCPGLLMSDGMRELFITHRFPSEGAWLGIPSQSEQALTSFASVFPAVKWDNNSLYFLDSVRIKCVNMFKGLKILSRS